MKTAVLNTLVFFISISVSFIVLELGLRSYYNYQVFALDPRGVEPVNIVDQSSLSIFDPLLGWRMTSDFASVGFNTGPYGLRHTNQAPDVDAATILAVGDSFTAGSEVRDAQAWPALLEGFLDTPVLNGGVGGYGVEQTVLRGEQLLESVSVETVLIGIFESDILRTQYDVYGGGVKPYFLIEDGALVHMNNPVPDTLHTEDGSDPSLLRRIAQYSIAIDRLAGVLTGQSQLIYSGTEYRTVHDQPAAVSCGLLERFAAREDVRSLHHAIVFQHGSSQIIHNLERTPNAVEVIGCAKDAGYQVIDEWDFVKHLYDQDPETMRRLYVDHGNGVLGHMTEAGNTLVAKLVALGMRNPDRHIETLEDAAGLGLPVAWFDALMADMMTNSGNIISDPASAQLANAVLVTVEATDTAFGATDQDVFRVTSTDIMLENYIQSTPVHIKPGIVTLSAKIDRALSTPHLRLHLRDATANVIVDFNLETEVYRLASQGDRPVDITLLADGDLVTLSMGFETEHDVVNAIFQPGGSFATYEPGTERTVVFSEFRVVQPVSDAEE